MQWDELVTKAEMASQVKKVDQWVQQCFKNKTEETNISVENESTGTRLDISQAFFFGIWFAISPPTKSSFLLCCNGYSVKGVVFLTSWTIPHLYPSPVVWQVFLRSCFHSSQMVLRCWHLTFFCCCECNKMVRKLLLFFGLCAQGGILSVSGFENFSTPVHFSHGFRCQSFYAAPLCSINW